MALRDNRPKNLSQGLLTFYWTRGISVSHTYLLYTGLQVNRNNKIVVLSSFTNYDDACDHYSCTPFVNPRWDIQYDKSTSWPSAANSASPEVDPGLGTNSSSPKLSLGYLFTANPVGGHSFNCGVHVFDSWDGLGRGLGRTSVSPEPGSDLDICNGKTSNVTRYCRADVLLRAFFIYLIMCQPLWYGQPPCQGCSGT
jgi:hypothetical protein